MIYLVAVGIVFLAVVSSDAQTAPPTAASTVAPLDNTLPNQYCVGCHNQRAKTAGLMLDSMDYGNIGKDAETWQRVIRTRKTGRRPPAGPRRPERATLDAFASDIEKRLDASAALRPNPGTPALHRLNRTEYANVIRDLLALDVDVAALLPQDDATDGFDNIADALG